ncbi:MAG TPA: CHASE3 domain-containing protein, partial [Candidatus Babeliaceae bacterium]|nr:CHASE3 domain-containing protein [Candidatus Babeliaceae bacterium]
MTHSIEVQKSLQTINNEVMKAESSIWSYRLSGDTSFLHPSLQERNQVIENQYRHLRKITAGSPVQQASLDTLYTFLQKKCSLLHQSVTWNFGRDGKYPLIKGALYNDSINRKIAGMNLRENHLLAAHSNRFLFLSNNFIIPILVL